MNELPVKPTPKILADFENPTLQLLSKVEINGEKPKLAMPFYDPDETINEWEPNINSLFLDRFSILGYEGRLNFAFVKKSKNCRINFELILQSRANGVHPTPGSCHFWTLRGLRGSFHPVFFIQEREQKSFPSQLVGRFQNFPFYLVAVPHASSGSNQNSSKITFSWDAKYSESIKSLISKTLVSARDNKILPIAAPLYQLEKFEVIDPKNTPLALSKPIQLNDQTFSDVAKRLQIVYDENKRSPDLQNYQIFLMMDHIGGNENVQDRLVESDDDSDLAQSSSSNESQPTNLSSQFAAVLDSMFDNNNAKEIAMAIATEISFPDWDDENRTIPVLKSSALDLLFKETNETKNFYPRFFAFNVGTIIRLFLMQGI